MEKTMKSSMNRRNTSRLNRLVFVSVITVFLLIIGVLFWEIFFSSSTSTVYGAELKAKCYTSIKIEAGDSLWAIAEEHASAEYSDMNDYIEEVKEINHITDEETIHTGQYIMIPYYENTYENGAF